MPLYLVNGESILFVHIPKTGGTSIENALSAVGPEFLNQRNFYKERERFARCSAQHLHWGPLARLVPIDQVCAFAVVRHPVARMVSEFRFRRGMRPRFRAMTTKRRFGPEPETFADWVRHALELRGRDGYIFDNHLRPQVDFVAEGVKHFRFEDGLSPVTDWLSDLTGVAITLPKRRFVASKGPDVTVDAETEAMIAEAYGADMATFGYGALEKM